ncbi:MAG TPA: hypothetical protein VIM73_09275 [Polyangiaceae bacterium]
MRTHGLAGALLGAAIALASSAGAAPNAFLEWDGPGIESGCLGVHGLTASVEAYLERSVFSPAPAENTVRVRMERREGVGWRALVRLQTAAGRISGDRELVSTSDACSSLEEPLTLAVALMVDSDLTAGPDELERESREPRRSQSPARPPLNTEERAVARWLTLDAAIIGALGTLPEPTGGAELGAELRVSRWLGLRGYVNGLVPRSRAIASGASVEFSSLLGGATACPFVEPGRWHLGACAGVGGGLAIAATREFEAANDSIVPFWVASGGLRFRVALTHRSSLGASATLLFRPKRERYVYELDGERSQVAEIPRLSAILGLGAAIAL